MLSTDEIVVFFSLNFCLFSCMDDPILAKSAKFGVKIAYLKASSSLQMCFQASF